VSRRVNVQSKEHLLMNYFLFCIVCDSIIQRFNEIQIDGKENNQIVNEMLSVCDTFTTSVAFVVRFQCSILLLFSFFSK
jgi:hypothetical protein